MIVSTYLHVGSTLWLKCVQKMWVSQLIWKINPVVRFAPTISMLFTSRFVVKPLYFNPDCKRTVFVFPQLRETKRVMSCDLERLLNHRQEMAVLKRTIASMVPPQHLGADDGNLLRSLATRRKSTPVRDDLTTQGKRSSEESDPRFPSPVVFTRQDKRKFNKERHRKLKELHEKL